MQNTGLDLQLEKESLDGSEWVFGAESLYPLFTIPTKEQRILCLPDGEVQRGKEDMRDCATRAPINLLEALFTYGVQNKRISEKNIAWLKLKGYADETGRVTFSDRFTAIKSGTRITGNSLKAPIQSIHRDGLIPKKMFPLESWMTWSDYHDKEKITEEMTDLARVFAKRFSINYEQIPGALIKEVNESELVVVAGYAWPRPQKDVYPRTERKHNHAWINIEPEYLAFDNYIDQDGNDFVKKLATDYRFYDYAYRVFISAENPNIVDEQFSIKFFTNIINSLKNILAHLLSQQNTMPPTQTKPVIEKTKEERVNIPREVLFKYAASLVGRGDVTPNDGVPDEVACAETVCTIIRNSICRDFPIYVSTIELTKALKRDSRFKATLDLKPGNIIISPTGSGNGVIRGHVGIFGENEKIMSNTSRTGFWEENYTIKTWVERWRMIGGMPIYCFEPQ